MGSTNLEPNKLEMYEFGPFEEDEGFQIGFLIGQKFSKLIQNRLSTDLILQNQLLPFAQLPNSQTLIHTLSQTNKNKFPNYWNELKGIAQGSGVPFLNVNFLTYPSSFFFVFYILTNLNLYRVGFINRFRGLKFV